MMIGHREEVCRLSFMGISEMIVIGENTEENLGWCAYYVRPGSWGICATITGKKSRDEILESKSLCRRMPAHRLNPATRSRSGWCNAG